MVQENIHIDSKSGHWRFCGQGISKAKEVELVGGGGGINSMFMRDSK